MKKRGTLLPMAIMPMENTTPRPRPSVMRERKILEPELTLAAEAALLAASPGAYGVGSRLVQGFIRVLRVRSGRLGSLGGSKGFFSFGRSGVGRGLVALGGGHEGGGRIAEVPLSGSFGNADKRLHGRQRRTRQRLLAAVA